MFVVDAPAPLVYTRDMAQRPRPKRYPHLISFRVSDAMMAAIQRLFPATAPALVARDAVEALIARHDVSQKDPHP